MNFKLIPSYRLLPEISILEKLKVIDETSAIEIFDNFKHIAEHRRTKQFSAPILTRLTQVARRAFTDPFFYYFRPATYIRDTFVKPNSSDPFAAASAGLNRDWAVTGDDLRAAINDYIESHNLTDSLSLTAQERKSLDYVARDYTRDYPRPAAPGPTKMGIYP